MSTNITQSEKHENFNPEDFEHEDFKHENLKSLHLNNTQMQVLVEALDLYSRVLIGQLEEVGGVATIYSVNMLDNIVVEATGGKRYRASKPCKNSFEEHHQFTDEVRLLKQTLLGIHSNGSYGIFNEMVHDNARVAYDIQQVVRGALAWERTPEGGMGVSFDTPHKSSQQPLPTITTVK